MPYLDVTWITGEVVDHTKLNQMQDNSDVLREQLRVRHLASFIVTAFTQTVIDADAIRFMIRYGSVDHESATLTPTPGTAQVITAMTDLSVASLTDNVKYVLAMGISVRNASGGAWVAPLDLSGGVTVPQTIVKGSVNYAVVYDAHTVKGEELDFLGIDGLIGFDNSGSFVAASLSCGVVGYRDASAY